MGQLRAKGGDGVSRRRRAGLPLFTKEKTMTLATMVVALSCAASGQMVGQGKTPAVDLNTAQVKATGTFSPRKVSDFLGDNHVSPKACGAKGDWDGGTGTNDAPAIQACLTAFPTKVIDLGGLTYRIDSGLTVSRAQSLRNGFLYAGNMTSGSAITIGPGGDWMDTHLVLDQVEIQGHSAPADKTYNANVDGVTFAAAGIRLQGVIVKGVRYGFVAATHSYTITMDDCSVWFSRRAVSLDSTVGTDMGAGFVGRHNLYAHNDAAVYVNLCEFTCYDCAFDSAPSGSTTLPENAGVFFEDNITDQNGVNNSETLLVNPRFEAGGDPLHPWVKNSGHMRIVGARFFDPMVASYLFDNSGALTIDWAFSRLVGDCYSSRNTGSGSITANGVKLLDRSGPTLRFTPSESKVFNGSIETGTTVGFTATGGTSALSAVTSSPVPFDGTYSLKITNGASSAATFRSDAIPLTPSVSQIHFTVMYQTTVQRGLYYEFYSTLGNVIRSTDFEYLNPTTGWTRSRHVQTVPAGAAYMRLRIDLSGSETINLDELYLSEW